MKQSDPKRIEIKLNDYKILQYHYYDTIQPLIRCPNADDEYLYVHLSPVSSRHCLYSRKYDTANIDEDPSKLKKSEIQAHANLDKILQLDTLYVNAKPVYVLGSGKYVVDGGTYEEVNFPDLLAVSILQQFFDDNNMPYVLVPMDIGGLNYWARSDTDNSIKGMFNFFGNLLSVTESTTEACKIAALDFFKSLPALSPHDFPKDKTVDSFSPLELIQLGKWLKSIVGIQPADIGFGMTVNPGGLSGILRAPRYFKINWELDGHKLELAAWTPYPKVTDMFDQFMKIAFSKESIEHYKPIRPFPPYISADNLTCRKEYKNK